MFDYLHVINFLLLIVVIVDDKPTSSLTEESFALGYIVFLVMRL